MNRIIDKALGYVLVYMPTHHRAKPNGYVYEHVVVAEGMIGRQLRENEDVHHLDFNRANNREENLLVLEHAQHTKLHNWISNGQIIDRNGERGLTIYCKNCLKVLSGEQTRYCSNTCFNIDNRKVDRPSRDDLQNDISSMSFLAIGRKYGVSDNAVRKWARIYGLI
jgi:hypothetical protein